MALFFRPPSIGTPGFNAPSTIRPRQIVEGGKDEDERTGIEFGDQLRS